LKRKGRGRRIQRILLLRESQIIWRPNAELGLGLGLGLDLDLDQGFKVWRKLKMVRKVTAGHQDGERI